MSVAGGFSITHGAHVGIGTLPIVLFGNEEQKTKVFTELSYQVTKFQHMH